VVGSRDEQQYELNGKYNPNVPHLRVWGIFSEERRIKKLMKDVIRKKK
jgi:hypothetical protein